MMKSVRNVMVYAGAAAGVAVASVFVVACMAALVAPEVSGPPPFAYVNTPWYGMDLSAVELGRIPYEHRVYLVFESPSNFAALQCRVTGMAPLTTPEHTCFCIGSGPIGEEMRSRDKPCVTVD